MAKSDLKNKTNKAINKPILNTENLSIGYESKTEKLVLEDNLNIEIHNGELVCLIGPNGCGKSTLMRTIAGLQKALNGKTFINNVQVKKLLPHKYAKLLSLVLTDKINAGALTVFDIVSIGRYPYLNYFGKLKEEDKVIIDKALQQVHLEKYSSRFFNELSDGEKQRVLIAKALAQDTPLIILDEPTAHLDLPNRVEIMNILKHLAKKTDKAILLSTHELDLALQTADSIWLMNRNTNLVCGAPEDLVLNGHFEKVFHGKLFDFDKSTGSFKLKHEGRGELYLEANSLAYTWTKRALERDGYIISSNPNTSIKIKHRDKIWFCTFNNQEKQFNSISDLLNYLRLTELNK